MKILTPSIRSIDLPRAALVAFAAVAVALASTGARAADPAEIDFVVVSAPAVKNVGVDTLTGAPLAKSTVTARVHFDPVTLTTYSGVALLRDGVLKAAARACSVVLAEDYGACVRDAVASASPQVDGAMARAKTDAAGG